MPNTKHWHLILCAVIGAELFALAVLPRSSRAAPTGTDSGHTGRAARRAISNDRAEAASDQTAVIDRLSAEKQALEEEIRALHNTSEIEEEGAVRVSVDFVKARRFGRSDSPISVLDEILRLLRITEDETTAITAARAKALDNVKAIERSLVRKVPATEGRAVFMVDPWPEQGEPIMAHLKAELSAALGESRGSIIFEELRDSTFVGGGKEQLIIAADHRRTPDDPFAGGGDDPFGGAADDVHSRITITHSAPIALDKANSNAVLERFGDLLEVETPEELQRLFSNPTEE